VRLSSEVVHRGLVRREGATHFFHEEITVPLARCDGTKRGHRSRVLPADILPRKTYALGVQEASMDAHRRSGRGLRTTLSSFTGEVPHPTTLHGWLGGAGAYALGRSTLQGVLPVGALLEATRRQRSTPTLAIEPAAVHPDRYRSEGRREALEMAWGLLVLAQTVFPDSPEPLPAWRGLILETQGVPAMDWWARIRTTAIQHRVRKPP
jgi:hypothetical protein